MSQQLGPQSIEDIDLIIDTDAHIGESLADFGAYLDEPYRNFVSGPDGSFEDTPWSRPAAELFRTLGGKTFMMSVADAEEQEEAMDMLDLDYALLTPNVTLSLPIYSDDRLAHAIANALNDWILAEFVDQNDRFKSVVSLTPHQPDLMAEEIDRVADHPDIVAGYMGSVGVFPALGNRKYEPMFDALVDNDLPLLLHGATGVYIGAHPWIKRALDTYWELHVISHPIGQMTQLTSLMGQGIPERYPDLTVVFQEAGVGWIPMTMYRMDNEFEKRRPEVPLLEKRPSEYITDPDGPFYFTSQPMAEPRDHEHLAQLIRMFNGGEKLMFSTDYPHYDFDTPEELFEMIRPHLSEPEIRNIFGETASKVFGL